MTDPAVQPSGEGSVAARLDTIIDLLSQVRDRLPERTVREPEDPGTVVVDGR